MPNDKYIKNIEEILEYGIPADKIVPGLPFFGTTLNSPHQPESYYNFVISDCVKNISDNYVEYNNVTYIINSQEEVRKKTEYSFDIGAPGIMFWDLADDVSISNEYSLLNGILDALK